MPSPSQQITDEVTSWPGVEAGTGKRGEFAFTLGRRELGHLHGDRAAHFGFPKAVWQELFDAGRIGYHPVFPGRPGFGARAIEGPADVRDVIDLIRVNYDRVIERHGVPEGAEFAGLHPSTPEALPFAPAIDVRAFLIERERGNLLIYSVGSLETDAERIESLGGISRQYLNHGHEAMFTSDWYRGPVFVHEGDRAAVEQHTHVRGTFSRRHMLDDDFEVIPTPGHTPGATAYLWDSGEHRFLFTGDTIYLSDGEWVDGLLDSSDRAGLVESLELIRDLDFDVLVPWGATGGQPWFSLTSKAQTWERIGAMLERIG